MNSIYSPHVAERGKRRQVSIRNIKLHRVAHPLLFEGHTLSRLNKVLYLQL